MAWTDLTPVAAESGWAESSDHGATATGHWSETYGRTGWMYLGVLDTECRGLFSFDVSGLGILTVTGATLTLMGITGVGECGGYSLGAELIDYTDVGGLSVPVATAWGGTPKATLPASMPITPRPPNLYWSLAAGTAALLVNGAKTRIGIRLRDHSSGLTEDVYWLPPVAQVTLHLVYGVATGPRLVLPSGRATRDELASGRLLRTELPSGHAERTELASGRLLRTELPSGRTARIELPSGWAAELPTREG